MELSLIQSKIHEIRGVKVMLDFDLAEMYQVETRALNQAAKRNIKRFPEDFMFQLTKEEWKNMSSQFVTTSRAKRPKSAIPLAFTEHGVVMLPSVLRSNIAVQASIIYSTCLCRPPAIGTDPSCRPCNRASIRNGQIESLYRRSVYRL